MERTPRRAFAVAPAVLGTLALSAAAVMEPLPAAAQADGIFTINEIRAITPDCRANPTFPWIGRVSGSLQGLLDNQIPVSFVGCFPDQRSCELWKGRASAPINTTIIQYSCRRRF